MLPPVRFPVVVLVVLGALLAPAAGARAAAVYFPGKLPPATQISRDLSLKKAAQAGVITLSAKGNGPSGDSMAAEVRGDKVKGPITVTLRVEFTVKPRVSIDTQDKVREALPVEQVRVEKAMNRGGLRTSAGDPVRFKLEFTFRAPTQPATPNNHQVTIIDPSRDLDVPEPGFRSRLDFGGVPNQGGPGGSGTFSSLSFTPKTLVHEMLHLAGLPDHYSDFYRVDGRDYPLPEKGYNPEQAAAFAKAHQPPLPTNGKVYSKNLPGYGACDIMGTGFQSNCRKISRSDLDWFASEAGVRVTAKPGDLLLNKDQRRQNYGVGFTTIVFARPGTTTVARGIAVYCIDHTLLLPFQGNFDVLGPAAQQPGYEALGKLLAVSGDVQTSLDEPPEGMLQAVWNVTDRLPLAAQGYADSARALLAQAGVAEDSSPDGGLPHADDANADAEATGAVTKDAVLPDLPNPRVKPILFSIRAAAVYPRRLTAGPKVRADLLVASVGSAQPAKFTLERRIGRRWRRSKGLTGHRLRTRTATIPIKLGRLKPGSYRVVISVRLLGLRPAVAKAPFTVAKAARKHRNKG